VAELVNLLEGDAADQVPRLLETGVLMIDAPVVLEDDGEDQEPDEDETAAG
jgi:hypothetical protein